MPERLSDGRRAQQGHASKHNGMRETDDRANLKQRNPRSCSENAIGLARFRRTLRMDSARVLCPTVLRPAHSVQQFVCLHRKFVRPLSFLGPLPSVCLCVRAAQPFVHLSTPSPALSFLRPQHRSNRPRLGTRPSTASCTTSVVAAGHDQHLEARGPHHHTRVSWAQSLTTCLTSPKQRGGADSAVLAAVVGLRLVTEVRDRPRRIVGAGGIVEGAWRSSSVPLQSALAEGSSRWEAAYDRYGAT